MEERLLQVDHRIPYEIGGEQDESNIDCYMLLSHSANRAKSWTCEHCPNWTVKDVEVCENCFWAYPDNYTHIAGKNERKIVVTFTDNEIDDYEQLINLVGIENAEQTIKNLVADFINENSDKD